MSFWSMPGTRGFLRRISRLTRIQRILRRSCPGQPANGSTAKLRNDLRQMADAYMRKHRDLPQAAGEFADLIPLLTEIHRRLPQKGKLKYGYMPKEVKNLVDEVVNRLEKHPKVAEL